MSATWTVRDADTSAILGTYAAPLAAIREARRMNRWCSHYGSVRVYITTPDGEERMLDSSEVQEIEERAARARERRPK